MQLGMRILAIDPGYDRLGIAVLEGNASRPHLLMSDCIEPPRGPQEERLAHIISAIAQVAREHTPQAVAVETLFFSVNKKTALGVAEARGAVLSFAGGAGLPVIECSPQQVKIAVTGYGASDKRAVALMIPRLVALTKKKRLDDELDAIAVGITALAMGIKTP